MNHHDFERAQSERTVLIEQGEWAVPADRSLTQSLQHSTEAFSFTLVKTGVGAGSVKDLQGYLPWEFAPQEVDLREGNEKFQDDRQGWSSRGKFLQKPKSTLDWINGQRDLRSRCLDWFLQHGTFTMAYSTLQPGIEYFETRWGYLAYNRCLGATFVLGDPIGEPGQHGAIIREFLQAHRNVCFCQVSRGTAAILSSLGWRVNEFGADMEIDLPTYSFEGPKKTKLRQAARKIEREGFTIEERPESDEDQHAVERLSASWLKTKSVNREARFLVRPLRFGPEPGVRKFFLWDEHRELVAFIAFDPICEDGKVVGYSPAIKRRSPNSPVGAEEALTKFAIERFQEEGLRCLRLGLMPLFDIQQSEFPDAWPMRTIFQQLYRYGNSRVYNFQGHADFKRRYRGALSKVYLASAHQWGNVYYLIALMRLCRIF
ncbi:DUF2156 domain-containing protein [Schlesneria paludicola]|uniref:DUF2156 domain-containing protein n=1 Tax=Schlesneria paludicola TaxID=360056 RepID=UPI0012F8287E|nr:DUF2156 domain-containing protein [Schlesneria paludicola]